MIDPNFQPPEPAVSKRETEKRKNLLPWIAEYFDTVTDSIIVAGSLSYGADYSVRPESDIDIQLVLNDEQIDTLATRTLFDSDAVTHAVEGYKNGFYQQFSLAGEKDGVSIECHFWNKTAFIDAVTYKSTETPRLRSSIETASTDFGFSFDGSSHSVDYFGEMIEAFPVSPFPSYRDVSGVLYLCRPITNILGGPIVVKESSEVRSAMDTCWNESIRRLKQVKQGHANPDSLTIVNALPSQYKMSPSAKAAVIARAEISLNQ